jgi:hypothetical protein
MIDYKVDILGGLRLKAFVLAVSKMSSNIVPYVANWLPTEQIWTKKPIASIIVLIVWGSKITLEKVFQLLEGFRLTWMKFTSIYFV